MTLFEIGFRPFFLGAGVFAGMVVALWAGVYDLGLPLTIEGVSTYQWHAHEMIYGYAYGVVAGFLLTAVRNWTGIQTVRNARLVSLFALWALARLLHLFGTWFIALAAVFDLVFSVLLVGAVSVPVLRVRQWRQSVILLVLVLMAVGNACFYAGYAGYLNDGARIGIYLGLYLVVGLILLLGGRVLPFFIERGLGGAFEPRKSKRLDVAVLLLFAAFAGVDIYRPGTGGAAWLAAGVLVVNSLRLLGWHDAGLWRVPLLWSLYLSMWLINLGFLMAALAPVGGISTMLVVHAFAYGGIGLATMAMMARVSLGHTGRDVSSPPSMIRFCFLSLLLGFVFRVVLPLFRPDLYTVWVALSQLLWIGAFVLFVVVYAPMLLRPRVDGRPG